MEGNKKEREKPLYMYLPFLNGNYKCIVTVVQFFTSLCSVFTIEPVVLNNLPGFRQPIDSFSFREGGCALRRDFAIPLGP